MLSLNYALQYTEFAQIMTNNLSETI